MQAPLHTIDLWFLQAPSSLGNGLSQLGYNGAGALPGPISYHQLLCSHVDPIPSHFLVELLGASLSRQPLLAFLPSPSPLSQWLSSQLLGWTPRASATRPLNPDTRLTRAETRSALPINQTQLKHFWARITQLGPRSRPKTTFHFLIVLQSLKYLRAQSNV